MSNRTAAIALTESFGRIRIRAVAMQLIADLDGRYVELHVVTDRGQTLAITCDSNSIFAIQQHIEQLSEECPETASL
ncbi:MAG: hypothetical protein WD711_11985 [Dongiaceae bacterium]